MRRWGSRRWHCWRRCCLAERLRIGRIVHRVSFLARLLWISWVASSRGEGPGDEKSNPFLVGDIYFAGQQESEKQKHKFSLDSTGRKLHLGKRAFLFTFRISRPRLPSVYTWPWPWRRSCKLWALSVILVAYWEIRLRVEVGIKIGVPVDDLSMCQTWTFCGRRCSAIGRYSQCLYDSKKVVAAVSGWSPAHHMVGHSTQSTWARDAVNSVQSVKDIRSRAKWNLDPKMKAQLWSQGLKT